MFEITLKTVTLTKPQARDLCRLGKEHSFAESASNVKPIFIRTGKTLSKYGLAMTIGQGTNRYILTARGYNYYSAMQKKGIDKKL